MGNNDDYRDPPPPQAPQEEEKPASKPWWKKWWGITLIVLLVLVVVGALADEPENDTDTLANDAATEEPSPDAALPSDPPPPSPTAEANAALSPSPTTEANEPPAAERPALSGAARCSDDTGDVADPDGGRPSTVHPGTDLTDVELRAVDGRDLTVWWRAQDSIPSSAGPGADGSIFWYVNISSSGGEPQYMASIELIGDEWFVGVFDWEETMHHQVRGEPAVNDNQLGARFPGELLERVGDSFSWQAGIEWGDATYKDLCPDEDQLARFPNSE